MSEEITPQILIIDNDDHIIRLVTMVLEQNGYSCTAARSGSQGISQFKAGHYDLVISDLNMPNGDGVTVVENIRKESMLPIIILTGFDREYADQLRYLRNVTVLRKPFAADALLDLVEVDLAGCKAT